jgi:hypothetical protein
MMGDKGSISKNNKQPQKPSQNKKPNHGKEGRLFPTPNVVARRPSSGL